MAERTWVGEAQAGLMLALLIRAMDQDTPYNDYEDAQTAARMLYKWARMCHVEFSTFEGKTITFYDDKGKLVDAIVGYGSWGKWSRHGLTRYSP